jgi:hypothetical protein
LKYADVSEVLTASITCAITLVMEAVRTSEAPIYFNETTWRYIPEGCHLHTRRRENLKSHYQYINFILVI